jgi:hypothetical protein
MKCVVIDSMLKLTSKFVTLNQSTEATIAPMRNVGLTTRRGAAAAALRLCLLLERPDIGKE